MEVLYGLIVVTLNLYYILNVLPNIWNLSTGVDIH